MHVRSNTPHHSPVLRCDYENAYESIYDSSYGTCFVFYDEEEMETDDGCNLIPMINGNMMPSGSSEQ